MSNIVCTKWHSTQSFTSSAGSDCGTSFCSKDKFNHYTITHPHSDTRVLIHGNTLMHSLTNSALTHCLLLVDPVSQLKSMIPEQDVLAWVEKERTEG